MARFRQRAKKTFVPGMPFGRQSSAGFPADGRGDIVEGIQMRHRLLAASSLVALAWLAPASAHADERDVGLQAQTGVAVTIYNQDLALVRDVRTIDIAAGENDVAFIDVSGRIQPETALLKSSRGKLDVMEQNFDFDLLTPAALLEKSVGRMVRIIVTNSETGEETVESAKVLSVAGG